MAKGQQVKCPRCESYIGKYDRRKKRENQLSPINGASLSTTPKQAPKITCTCGMVVVILKGSL